MRAVLRSSLEHIIVDYLLSQNWEVVFLELVAVVIVEIIKLYLVQTGRFLGTTGYVAPSPNHVQNNVQKRS